MTHTPIPWEIKPTKLQDDEWVSIGSENDDGIIADDIHIENAQFIIHAANTIERLEKERDALLEAAKDAFWILKKMGGTDKNVVGVLKNTCESLKQAITQCGGGDD